MSTSTVSAPPAPEELARLLARRLPDFRQVRWVASTGSTNADLLAQARHDAPPATPWLLGAYLQESGRGRAGRPWQNRAGAAMMCSYAFNVDVGGAQLASLSPLAGLAVCEALRNLAASDALCVKWPNDVQWHDAKLAGVLVETVRNAQGGYTVVIGVGLNMTDATALSQALQRQVADWQGVCAATACPAGLADVASAIGQALHDAVRQWQTQGFEAFISRYAQVDALQNRPVNVLDQGKVLRQGTAQGLDEQGRLLLATSQGVAPIIVGEISVRAQ